MRDEFLWCVFGPELVWCFAHHEGFGLREEIRCEHFLVLVVGNGVMRFGSKDEIGGDELRTLVEELEERVLGVGCGLAEENGPGGVFNHCAITGDGLAVRFHGQLL